MTGQAMQNALNQVADAFRVERKERKEIMLQGHRVQELVEAGRYSFAEACHLMQVDAKKVDDALLWLIDDNARMNALYPVSQTAQQPFDYMMVGWMQDEQTKAGSAQVIDFMSALSKATAMQQQLSGKN